MIRKYADTQIQINNSLRHEAVERLERNKSKGLRCVLRGGSGSNATFLPGDKLSNRTYF